MSSEEKAPCSAAYKEQQQQHCNAVGAELKQARINLERTLTEESCWREASRLNTVYLERAVYGLRVNGHVVDNERLQYLSPLGLEHINLTGVGSGNSDHYDL